MAIGDMITAHSSHGSSRGNQLAISSICGLLSYAAYNRQIT
jgi:hypothetical protein